MKFRTLYSFLETTMLMTVLLECNYLNYDHSHVGMSYPSRSDSSYSHQEISTTSTTMTMFVVALRPVVRPTNRIRPRCYHHSTLPVASSTSNTRSSNGKSRKWISQQPSTCTRYSARTSTETNNDISNFEYALLFDCDGVILETEELHRLAYNEAFRYFNLTIDNIPVTWSVRTAQNGELLWCNYPIQYTVISL
jgi:hypothetical protein